MPSTGRHRAPASNSRKSVRVVGNGDSVEKQARKESGLAGTVGTTAFVTIQ